MELEHEAGPEAAIKDIPGRGRERSDLRSEGAEDAIEYDEHGLPR